MTTHKDTAGIIERLESAEGPDRGLDAEIGMIETACRIGKPIDYARKVMANFDWPEYSRSIDAALSLVPEGLSATIVRYADGRGKAVLWRNGEVSAHFDSSSDNAGCPASPAIALCIAALKARARAHKGEG